MESFQENNYFRKNAEQRPVTLLAYYGYASGYFQNNYFVEYLWAAVSVFAEVFGSLCRASAEWSENLISYFSCGFWNWDRKLEMTDRTLFWNLRLIKPNQIHKIVIYTNIF